MASSQDVKSRPLSPKTIALGTMLFFCVLMGVTGVYVKHRIDQAEVTLAAPDSAFAPGQELYEKTIISLGYGGFLGAAQEYIDKHEPASLSDMRMNYKTAQEILVRIGDKASTPIRRDMRAILDLYASILAKAEEGTDALSQGLSNADLLAAASALSMLDSRLASAQAAQRAGAQADLRKWSLALSMIALGGLALAMTMAFWGLWSADGRQSEYLDILAQSVSNMVHGDIQKTIWGIERSDKIGELARTIDLARMYFTQVPDVSIMGQDGPIRLKFDGESRSLFQAMMKKITESYERAQTSALGFTGALGAQQDLLKSLVEQIRATLENLQSQGSLNAKTVQELSASLSQASRELVNMQENGRNEIAQIVPFMKERVQNMAEVTHLAGQQVTNSLQQLMTSEMSLRASASQSQQAVKQLTQATGQMGERMFAALNLMQATSKALGETIDASQTRFNEAVDTLTRGETNMTKILTRAEQRLTASASAEETMAALVTRTASSAEKLEKIVNAIGERHETVDEQILTAAHRMDSIVANFDSAQRAMNESAGQIRRDGALVANLLSELRANNDQLLSTISQNSQVSFNAAQTLAEKSHALMQRLEVQIAQQAQMAETRIDELTVHGQSMAQQASTTTASLSQAVLALKGEQDKLAAARGKFTETVNDLGLKLESHATSTFGKTEQWAAQSFTKISSITEQMESFMSRLAMLGQLTGTLGTVAGQLGQIVPALTQIQPAALGEGMTMLPMPPVDMESTKALIVRQTEDVIGALHKQWHEALVQIEAMHDQLAQIVVQQKDQLETRLVVMDKKIRETSEALEDEEERAQAEEKQAEIINEVIAAIAKINAHVLELDEVIEEAGLRKEA